MEFATDGYPLYAKITPQVFGRQVSIANIVGTEKVKVSGNPNMEDTGTVFVERHNLTIRMSLRRYARKTNAFAKKVQRTRARFHLCAVWFNWCRVHQTLRMPPALYSGLTDTLHDVGFIVDLIEAQEERTLQETQIIE